MSWSTLRRGQRKLFARALPDSCGLTGHSLRKAFAIKVLRLSGDFSLVQVVLGHRSRRTTLRYLGLGDDARAPGAAGR